MSQSEKNYVRAAVRIARATSPYSGLAWICNVREAVSHLLSERRVDELLIELHQAGEIVLERADLVQGVEELAGASELTCLTETWHYAGLPREA